MRWERESLLAVEDAEPHGGEDGLQLGPRPELSTEVPDVIAYGVRADAEILRDPVRAPTLRHQAQHLELPWRDPRRAGGMGCRCRLSGRRLGATLGGFGPACSPRSRSG